MIGFTLGLFLRAKGKLGTSVVAFSASLDFSDSRNSQYLGLI